ncbi:TIR domain-containing protein [Novosphingobium sp. TH158]|uniref:TIR domain-containing protein n=1 Tax=Novosphingobium sp. TH158 TaxID=2067455 RepID=UPI000C7B29DA|nr:hypothetical protein C0V78_07170 [Novosphingobium sp. TH158]
MSRDPLRKHLRPHDQTRLSQIAGDEGQGASQTAKVFLVYGRDEAARHAVARILETSVGLDVVILSERPNKGRSILTKVQEESGGTAFAVILMAPDDLGRLRQKLLPSGSPAPVAKFRRLGWQVT